jgi:hypothetical protein
MLFLSGIVRTVSGIVRTVSGIVRTVSGIVRTVSGIVRTVSGIVRTSCKWDCPHSKWDRPAMVVRRWSSGDASARGISRGRIGYSEGYSRVTRWVLEGYSWVLRETTFIRIAADAGVEAIVRIATATGLTHAGTTCAYVTRWISLRLRCTDSHLGARIPTYLEQVRPRAPRHRELRAVL